MKGKIMEEKSYSELSADEKRVKLYLDQKKLLDTFLENGAISRAQYQKSLNDLTVKMGMEAYLNKKC